MMRNLDSYHDSDHLNNSDVKVPYNNSNVNTNTQNKKFSVANYTNNSYSHNDDFHKNNANIAINKDNVNHINNLISYTIYQCK